MGKTEIYGAEFDLETAASCAQAQNLVNSRITELTRQKGELEKRLDSRFYDFEKSQQDYTALKLAADELTHCERLLKSLDEKHQEALEKESAEFAKALIGRLETQSAALAALCFKEVPTASRKLTVIAAALQKYEAEVERAVEVSKMAGIAFPHIDDPLQRIAGEQAFVITWLRNLRLPLLDEQPDIACFWPLTNMEQYPDSHQDNPKIEDDVEELFSAEDMHKAAKVLFEKIEKRKTIIRQAESGPYLVHDYDKKLWFQRPRGEWAELLTPNPVSSCIRQLGDKIKFWLELPQQRKPDAFIHLLNDDERDRVLAKLPESERQKYWDYMADYENGDELDESAVGEKIA